MRVCSNETLYGDDLHLTGHNNTIYGNRARINGHNNTGYGDDCVVSGHNNTWYGSNNQCNGNNNTMYAERKMKPKVISPKYDLGAFSGAIIGNVGSAGTTVIMDADGMIVDGVRSVFNNFPGSVVMHQSSTPGLFIGSAAVTKRSKTADEPRYVQVPTEAETSANDKEQALEDGATCSVCMSNEPVCVTTPCMHRCLCCACARTLAADGTKERGAVLCPQCRGVVKKIKVVH